MKEFLALLAACLAQPALAAPSAAEFHRAVYALHEEQIAKRSVRTEVKTGEFKGVAAAGYRYQETSYFDAATGRLLSRMERNADRPEAIHSAEVSVHDDDGRLVRGYLSIALPWAPDKPVRTWINLHHYNGSLHSYRQFNLAGEVSYEFCEGTLEGRPVKISLDGSDVDAGKTTSAAYRACFDGMRNDWERYTTPH